jgi:hypothetical protein
MAFLFKSSNALGVGMEMDEMRVNKIKVAIFYSFVDDLQRLIRE